MAIVNKSSVEQACDITFASVTKQDFESLVALRIAAMRDSLERVGRFDPVRARERLKSGFKAEYARHILFNGAHAGFFVLKPSGQVMLLDHLYIHPDYQGQGIGAMTMINIIAQADALGLPIQVSALKGSRSNHFYQSHGFVETGESEWDICYLRAFGTEM